MLTQTGGLALLVSWPLICIFIINRAPLREAVTWLIFLGFLFLPPGIGIDLPAIPRLDNISASTIGVFLGLIIAKIRLISPEIKSKLIIILIITMILQPITTTVTNREISWSGAYVAPGLTYYDAISFMLRNMIIVMPFLIGYCVLGSKDGHRALVRVLFISGLAYSLLALIEVRLSPQINVWVYGYFQHSFAQMMREGGFRPIVFLPHGLWVAFFFMATAIAALILWRAEGSAGSRGKYLLGAGYLLVVLVLCKSLGSLMFAVFLAPLIAFTGPRLQVRVAAVLAAFAILYPALRGADLVPVNAVVDFARSISEERAQSLQFRLNNEDLLLARASEKPLFGWGGYGRNRIYDEWGKKVSVTDGYWIIVIGRDGWIGFVAQFGLLGAPIFLLYRRMRRGFDPGPISSGVALLLAINMIELLPNATLTIWTWMMAGALLGRVENEASGDAARAAAIDPLTLRKRPRTIL